MSLEKLEGEIKQFACHLCTWVTLIKGNYWLTRTGLSADNKYMLCVFTQRRTCVFEMLITCNHLISVLFLLSWNFTWLAAVRCSIYLHHESHNGPPGRQYLIIAIVVANRFPMLRRTNSSHTMAKYLHMVIECDGVGSRQTALNVTSFINVQPFGLWAIFRLVKKTNFISWLVYTFS